MTKHAIQCICYISFLELPPWVPVLRVPRPFLATGCRAASQPWHVFGLLLVALADLNTPMNTMQYLWQSMETWRSKSLNITTEMGVCVCVKLCTLENNTISEKIVMIGMIVAIIIIIRSTFWRIPKCPGLTPSHFIPSSRHKAKAALPLSIASSIFLPSECANHFQQARVA